MRLKGALHQFKELGAPLGTSMGKGFPESCGFGDGDFKHQLEWAAGQLLGADTHFLGLRGGLEHLEEATVAASPSQQPDELEEDGRPDEDGEQQQQPQHPKCNGVGIGKETEQSKIHFALGGLASG